MAKDANKVSCYLMLLRIFLTLYLTIRHCKSCSKVYKGAISLPPVSLGKNYQLKELTKRKNKIFFISFTRMKLFKLFLSVLFVVGAIEQITAKYLLVDIEETEEIGNNLNLMLNVSR